MNNSVKYFFNRTFEILHRKSFDSYRLSLNNPVTIFSEFNSVLDKYRKKKVKHFEPTVTEVGCEILDLLDNDHLGSLLEFKTFSKKQIITLINEACSKSKNDKKIRSLALISKTVLTENPNFKKSIFDRIIELLEIDNDSSYSELDTLTSWLISHLVYLGFSKDYIESRIRKCGNRIFRNEQSIREALNKLNDIFDASCDEYKVIFKLKKNPSQELKYASTAIEEISDLPEALVESTYVNTKFKEKNEGEIFISVKVFQYDFWASLVEANQMMSSSLEINSLHNSENSILLENQAVSIHTASNKFRVGNIQQIVDGFYTNNDSEFNRFIQNLSNIESNTAKEKIHSAIRFYKLGNESVEMEHKILNYWIGFEQLYSAIDSNEDSINRMKVFYTSLNISFYFQRRLNYLFGSLDRSQIKYDNNIIDQSIFSETFDQSKLSGSNPLLIARLNRYFDLNSNKEIKRYVELHSKRLNQHLTRIYRVRNELVHEGKTKMNARLLAGHLRHYLIFSIEQITNELAENETLDKLDDVFVYYENLKERIKLCQNFDEILALKSYQGYME